MSRRHRRRDVARNSDKGAAGADPDADKTDGYDIEPESDGHVSAHRSAHEQLHG